MSKLYLREWSGITGDRQAPSGIITDQTPLDYSGGVQTSAAFKDGTTLLEWSTDAICSWVLVQVGETGNNATTNDMRYPADSHGFVGVSPGMKISVIANT